MSLPARKVLPLKSLYVWVLLAMISTLGISFLVFRAISQRVQTLTIDPIYDRFDELQLESARGIWQSSGQATLKDYLNNLDRIFGGAHYLLDSNGIDVSSGANRSFMIPRAPAVKARTGTHGHWMIAHRSQDGRFWFAAEGQLRPPHVWTFLPYYFLVIGATGVLCWLAAVGVITPIRRIEATIARFGRGDLSIRVKTRRTDEIGQLGRSFNEMAERLERLIVSERRLLSDISHELRSPLARLKFATRLARTSEHKTAALDRIERDLDRITSLVSDIVDINFAEGDPALHGTETISVKEIVREVVCDCAVEAEVRGCTIKVTNQTNGSTLGNRELLRRALENVLRNAIRYAPERTHVAVCAIENATDAIISVRDHGPGVPDQVLTRIFDPFFRVEEARDANGAGSGLGLSIAKRAVQLHHGTICAENASPGLLVKIAIPLVLRGT